MYEPEARKKATEYEREHWKSESTLVRQAWDNSRWHIPTLVLSSQALWR
jgi:hypothetical protein